MSLLPPLSSICRVHSGVDCTVPTRDPAASKPSQDSWKWQEYDEEKGDESCSLADSGRHHFSGHRDQERRTWHAHCDDRHDRRQSEGFLRRRVFDQCVSSETIQPQEGPTCKAQEKWIDWNRNEVGCPLHGADGRDVNKQARICTKFGIVPAQKMRPRNRNSEARNHNHPLATALDCHTL
jgi:hypothetical protein